MKLLVLFCLFVSILLVGTRFEANWAGGKGYQKTAMVSVVVAEASPVAGLRPGGSASASGGIFTHPLEVGNRVRRGERIATDGGSRIILQAGETQIALDENTDIVFEVLPGSRAKDAAETNTPPTHPTAQITLFRGRILLQGPHLEGWQVQTPEGTLLEVLESDDPSSPESSSDVSEQKKLSVVFFDFLQTVNIMPFHLSMQLTAPSHLPFETSKAFSIHEIDPVTVTEGTISFDHPFYVWAENKFKND